MTTNLRCKEGDLAVITQEEIGCEANIGRLVYVIRRAEPYSDFDPMDEWWIESASVSPLVFLRIGSIPRQIGCDSNPVKHSDRWLRPIRDPGDLAIDEMSRKCLSSRSLACENRELDVANYLLGFRCSVRRAAVSITNA
jgi:hypothetical protein